MAVEVGAVVVSVVGGGGVDVGEGLRSHKHHMKGRWRRGVLCRGRRVLGVLSISSATRARVGRSIDTGSRSGIA